MDPALLAGVDDADDEDTSFPGVDDEDTSFAGVDDEDTSFAGVDDEDTSFARVDDEDTSFAGVPVPNTTVMTNADDNLDAKSNHNSVDPNKPDRNSSKASVHSTRSNLSVHSATGEPPQHPPDEEDNISEDQPSQMT